MKEKLITKAMTYFSPLLHYLRKHTLIYVKTFKNNMLFKSVYHFKFPEFRKN